MQTRVRRMWPVLLLTCGLVSGHVPAGLTATDAAVAASGVSASVESVSVVSASGPTSVAATVPAWKVPGVRNVLATYRLAGFCGYPGAPGQGRLGIGRLQDRAAEIARLVRGYRRAGAKAAIPVLELIAVTVTASPGSDRMWRRRTSDAVIAKHLAAARSIGGMLLLNVQPGQSSFMTEAKALSKWLKQPDVGLAMDPEWRMHPGQVPMRQFGWVTGAELQATASYVAGLVKANRLPEKVVLFHQLAVSIVRDPGALKAVDGITWVRGVDGIGSRSMKTATYKRLTTRTPSYVHSGFKLFFVEDRHFGPLMTLTQVLALAPRPDYVMYE